MDLDRKGPETQPQLEVGNKPRAPPIAKKPKPLPPKKPSLPAKPLSKKPEVQNGDGSDHIQQALPDKPDQDTAQSFPPASPKASPTLSKGSPRTSRPNRTPPPLPKHPPKGPKSRVPSERSFENSNSNESDSVANDCDKNELISTNTVLVNELNSFLKKSKSFDDKTSDNGNIETPNSIINGSVPPKDGRIENHSKAGSPGERNIKVAPKVPLKPKPRPDKKLKEKVNEQSAEEVKNDRSESPPHTNTKSLPEDEEHQIGKSTWFAQSTEAKPVMSVLKNFDNTDNSENTGSQNILRALTKSSPRQSPKVPRKPLPRIPSKSSNPQPVATDTVPNKDKNGNLTVHFSKSEDDSIEIRRHQEDTILGSKDTYLKSDKDHSAETIKDSAVFNKDVCESVPDKDLGEGKPQTFPKPVPRRSIPLGRPVPTPRKRQSINRLSGTEDSFNQDPLMTSSVHDLSMDFDSKNNENEFLNAKERMVKAKSEENVFSASKGWSVVTGTIDISGNSDDGNTNKSNNVIDNLVGDLSVKQATEGTVVNSFVKSRVVFSEKGEEKQYRVIDKSVVTSQSQLLESHQTSRSPSPGKDTFVRQDNVSQDMAKDSESDENKSEKSINTSTGENRVDENPDNLDDILSDRTILEPSSLLNEIEEILSRSHKHLSLTRAGSSPEKRVSPLLALKSESNRYERSRSVDSSSVAGPVRPPRPKKEQRRVRAHSQLMYDSCGSDTESLPDTSQTADENLTLDEKSMTLGRAKPHPPKPKRHNLLKVQRSQSDITAMKTFVDKQGHKRQQSDGGPMTITDQEDEVNPSRPKSWRKGRPSKKAPPPPPISPYRGSPTNLNMVVPVSKQGTKITKDSKKKRLALDDLGGTVYNSIADDGICSSEGEHDYHEIPEDIGKSQRDVNHNSRIKAGHMVNLSDNIRDRSGSPPKLPPRNSNNSMSFETSSSSSVGHEFDSMMTSSVEDVSLTSTSRAFPKTSSPNVVVKVTPDDLENEVGFGASPVTVKQRPPSGISLQSDSGSGSHVTEHISTSESDGEDEKKNTSKKDRKLFLIVQEIASSERVFVDVLNLLNVDFRKHISNATESHGRPVIPAETLNRILDYLPQLQNFNEDLLKDLETRISKWDEQKGISDIFVKKGPFLKLYTSYIKDFETMMATLDEALKKYPAFQASVKEFEMSPRCASLALKHYMLKPIQRIPQYRLLLQDYFKHLPENSPEMKDTQTALDIVSEVAHHANENRRHGDFVQKMLEIQRSLIGQFEVIKPGRTFLKEGELMKLSRKEMQPRFFFLFNDVLLYTTPVATGYRLNNVLPLAGMKVSVAAQDEFKTEFSIISVQRSFTLHSPNLEERDDWVSALNSAIEENALKRNTFEAVRAGAQDALEIYSDWISFKVMLDKDFVLGCKAPLWIPDARVTMCMLCTCEFTVTWRRHHCRACGRVVCGNCSECKAPLRYLKYKPARVCDECYKSLKQDAEREEQEHLDKGDNTPSKEPEESSSFLSLKNGLLQRFQKIRRSGRSEKKSIVRPLRLVEVNANDEGASMSGYLNRLQKGKKWKRSWYLVKEKVLYTFKATQDTAAAESMVLLGYEVSRFTDFFEGVEPDLLFQLSHSNTAPIVFRTDSATATEKWVNVMRESSVT